MPSTARYPVAWSQVLLTGRTALGAFGANIPEAKGIKNPEFPAANLDDLPVSIYTVKHSALATREGPDFSALVVLRVHGVHAANRLGSLATTLNVLLSPLQTTTPLVAVEV